MKIALLVFSIMMSSQLFAKSSMLSYKDGFEVKKTIVKKDLPVNFYKLFHIYKERRMIAGDFAVSEKKEAKKSYLDGLRSRLQNSKGLIRF